MKIPGAARVLALAFVGAMLATHSNGPRAYQHDIENGTPTAWRTTVAGIWDNPTKTLTWHFNTLSFPQATWPTVAQAGAAFENSYRTLQDVVGADIKIVRGPDTTGAPATGDGKLEMLFALDEKQDPFNQNIAGAFAVTYVNPDGNGNMIDGDVVMNGDPLSFPFWATTYPPPNNSNDVETTACHEQIHSVGGGHPVYFYSMVWPTGRFPELLLFDRCIAPDDRVLMRTLYPGTPALRTITGTVTGAAGAVVVATDANGVPQATRITDGAGAYSINVP